MKLLRLAVSSALFAGAIAACAQPDDVPALQEETTQVAKSYQQRFDELEHRAREIKADGLSGTTMHAYQLAISTIGDAKNQLRQLPTRIAAGVKNHSADELHKLLDDMNHRFEQAVLTANTELTAVEDQAALARHGLVAAQAAPEQAPNPHARAADGSTDNAPVQ